MNASNVATWSYGIALAAYAAFAIRVALGWRRSVRASLLLAAMLATALWAASCAVFSMWEVSGAWLASNAADALRYGIWFAFLENLLKGARDVGGEREVPRPFPPWARALAAASLVASLALSESLPFAQLLGFRTQRAEFVVRLGLAVIGLMLVEQVLRTAHSESRWSVKPLCVALGGVFGFDLVIYSDAMLFGRLDLDMWIARGAANAMVIPFIAIATARNTGWTIDMHVSRGAVFHSTALIVSGAFLLAVAAAGYFVRFVSGDWGRALQIEFVFGALLLLALVASSGRFRSKLKVFVSKHFFSYRYDYREEWLRFTRTLSTESSVQGVQERAIMAIANLVESPAGLLWLAADGRGFQPAARWNTAAVDHVEPEDGPLATFLARSGWIVSLDEHASSPSKYPGLSVPAWLASIPDAWLIVPLVSGSDTLGFVVLMTPHAAVDVNWEVRDLLKTASRQAASYLGHLKATEALLEARKFDAFNRMSAFVVHDLKNLVAQLSLMLSNAERHRDNPDFQRDMLATVEHVVERMNKLMLQLRTGTTPVESARPVDLGSVVRRVCATKTNRGPPIELDLAPGVVAAGHEERLEHVIGHIVQNALDATDSGGRVAVRLSRRDRFAVIEIADTGVGMSAEFVRDRLFKPFETTKQAGMGIGVYESTQYISGLGGQVLIDSSPEAGTRVRVLIPAGDGSAAATASLQEVA